MALKAVLASQADLDALPEAIRALYVAKNGKYYLDAENVDYEGGLKSALDKERSTAGNLQKQLADLTAKLGDLDPEKAREAMNQLRELQVQTEMGEVPETLRPTFDKVLTSRTAQMKQDHDNQLKALQKQIEKAHQDRDSLTGTLRTMTLTNGIRSRAAEIGVRPEHFEDVVARMTMMGVDGIKWDYDHTKPEGQQIIAKRADGSIAYGKDATKPMAFDEGFEILRKNVPTFFLPNSGGGASNSGGNGQQGGGVTLTRSDAKVPAKYQAAKAQAEKAGVPLMIEG